MKKKTVPSKVLIKLLKNRRVKLDCGHFYTVHQFSNIVMIMPNGETRCHNCYY